MADNIPSPPESLDLKEEKEVTGTILRNSSGLKGNLSREAELEEMINLADEKDTRNVILLVGQEETGVLRFVLNRFLISLSSPDFQNLIGEPSVKELAITEVDGASFQQINNYISLRSDWTFDGNLIQAFKLKEAARRFHLDDLEEQILSQVPELKREKDFPQVVCNILNERRSDEDLKLRDDAMNYISSHANQFVQKEELFLSLSSDAITEILSNQKLPVLSDLKLFKLLLRWGIERCKREFQLCHGRFLREKVKGLLKFINFVSMTPFEIKSYVLFSGVLNSSEEKFITRSHKEAEDESVSAIEKIQAELFQTKLTAERDSWELKLKIDIVKENQKLLIEEKENQAKEVSKAMEMILGMLYEFGSGFTSSRKSVMCDELTANFSCIVELGNRTLKRLRYGACTCYGLGEVFHPMPPVIESFTKELFSFECSKMKSSKSQTRDRISCGFLYGLEIQPQKFVYFAVRFVVRDYYGSVTLAFVDSPSIRQFDVLRSVESSKYGQAHSTGETIKLTLEKDSLRVDLSLLVDEQAEMNIQVWHV